LAFFSPHYLSRIKAHKPASNNHHSNKHQSFVQQTALTAGQKSAGKDNQSESETTSDIQSQVQLNPSPFGVPFRGEPFVPSTVFGQPKLNIGTPKDNYEVEADRVADKVVKKSNTEAPKANVAPLPVQKKDSDGPEESEGVAEEPVQMMEASEKEAQIQEKPIRESITTGIQLKPIAPTEEAEVQKKEEDSEGETEVQAKLDASTDTSEKIQKVAATDEESNDLQKKNEGAAGGGNDVESSLKSSKGKGSAMDDNTRSSMESGFGADFSGVRIHTDSNAVQMNKSLGSQAFANGSDVYFNEGKYNPSSKDGQHLLAHELTHTVQQGASGKSIQKKEESVIAEDKKSTEDSTNEILQDELGDDVSIANPPKADPDEKKPSESDKDTDDAKEESSQVMPESNRVQNSGSDVQKNTAETQAEAKKTPVDPSIKDKKIEKKQKKKLSDKEKAALEAEKAFKRAALLNAPQRPRMAKMPLLTPPKNAAGKPVNFNPQQLQKLQVITKRAELIRQRGFNMRVKATEQMIAAEQMKGDIYLMFETIYKNKEALLKQKSAQEERFSIIDKTKEFQRVTEERTQKSVTASPEIDTKTTALETEAVPIAEEAKEARKEQDSQHGKSDDPDIKKSQKESSGQLGETEVASEEAAANAENMKADSETIKAQLPKAIADNAESSASILRSEKQLVQIDAKFAEIESVNLAAIQRLQELLAEPEKMLKEAKRLDKKAEKLIRKSEAIENKVHEVLGSYMNRMASVPETEEESVQKKDADTPIQRQTEDGTDDVVQKQNQFDQDTTRVLSPEELQIIDANNFLDTAITGLEGEIIGQEGEAALTEGFLGALEQLIVSAMDDVTNVPWLELPNMMLEEAERAVNNPGEYFLETLEMIGGYFVPRAQMPGEPMSRYLVDSLAKNLMGLSIVLGLVAAALGLTIYLMPVISFFFPPLAAFLWPFVPWMTTTMGVCGYWALMFVEISFLLRVSILLNDIIMYSFASSAEEQKQWADMMEQNINGMWEPLMIILPLKFFNKFKKPRKKQGGSDGDGKKVDGQNNETNTNSDAQKIDNKGDDILQGDAEKIDSQAHQDQLNEIDPNSQNLTDDMSEIDGGRKDRENISNENTPEGEFLDSKKLNEVNDQQTNFEGEIAENKKNLDELNENLNDNVDSHNSDDKETLTESDNNNGLGEDKKKLRDDELEHSDLEKNNEDKEAVNTNQLQISDSALNHADTGDFTINPKTNEVSRMKGGGHGQRNIEFLNQNNIQYNIVKEYSNGVRIGNVPNHKTKFKRTGTGQAWFPEGWAIDKIRKAGNYVANLAENINAPDGVAIFGNYDGVKVGIIKTNGEIGTIFPDINQPG